MGRKSEFSREEKIAAVKLVTETSYSQVLRNLLCLSSFRDYSSTIQIYSSRR